MPTTLLNNRNCHSCYFTIAFPSKIFYQVKIVNNAQNVIFVTRFGCSALQHMLNIILKYLFSMFENVLLVGIFSLMKGVGFEFNIGQHNMHNTLNDFLFVKHEKSHNIVLFKTMHDIGKAQKHAL
jgi:hypothetical protein